MKLEPLISLARESIESKLEGKKLEVSEKIKNEYSKNGACFVTLTINGSLRGCIGSIVAHRPLWMDVVENAKAAAFSDPRFFPLTKEEFDRIRIEISVLTNPKQISFKDEKELLEKIDNKMGLILKSGIFSSTFLPQVWEQIPSKKEFLENLSLKAGLSKDAWKKSEIFFYRVISKKES
ncbi:AmmeMemoRadiSam system protein A [Candidatus Pacearchaeota archaeon]|nr:MAG: AmmeMemoRadiSam system protein A [Candidatus Pacearchaeota archaeon]